MSRRKTPQEKKRNAYEKDVISVEEYPKGKAVGRSRVGGSIRDRDPLDVQHLSQPHIQGTAVRSSRFARPTLPELAENSVIIVNQKGGRTPPSPGQSRDRR